MIEILSIFFTFLSLLIFSNFPLSHFSIENKLKNMKITYSETLLLNIVINCNIFLLLSFFSVNLNFIFLIITIYVLIFFYKNFKNYLQLLRNNFFLWLIFLILFYSLSILIAKKAYLEYDGLAHWIFKAKVFFQGGTYENLVGLPSDHYPHLGSYMWAFFWKNSLLQYEYLGRLFFIFIFLLCIFSLNSKFNNKFSQFERIIIIFLITLFSTNFYLFGGYQEYFIFFCFFCFSCFFIKFCYLKKNNIKNFIPEILIFLTLNIMLWTKQEGFFYFLILGLIFMLHAKRNLINKIFLLTLVVLSLISFSLIKSYYFGGVEFSEKIINPEIYKNLNIEYLFSKLYIITKYFLISFIKYPIWIIIILSLVYLSFKSDYLKHNYFIFTFIFLSIIFIYGLFLHIHPNLKWLVPLTLNRLIFGLSGFLIFINIEMFNQNKKF